MFIVIDWIMRMERITRRKESGMAKSSVIFGLRSCIQCNKVWLDNEIFGSASSLLK
jgi:hypothetical protein